MVRLLVCGLLAGCGRLNFAIQPDSSQAACPTVATLADDFDGAANVGWTVQEDPPVTVARANGQLTINLADTLSGIRYGAYATVNAHDLRDHCVFVTAVATPIASEFVEMGIELGGGGLPWRVGVRVVNGQLDGFVRNSPAEQLRSVFAIAFDPAGHRRWRLREVSGVLFWETAPADGSWATRGMEPTPYDFRSVGIELFAGSYEAVAGPGVAVFDDLDTP